MKLFAFITRLSAASIAVVLLNSTPALAQMPGGGAGLSGLNLPVFIKLFGVNTNFVSKADARVVDKNHKETTSMVMGFDMLAGSIRLDINMADVKSREMSPEFANSLKTMGMDQMTTILLPDQKTTISIYPSLKSYAQSPMPKDELDAFSMPYKIEKSRVGKETVDGHACDKYAVTVTDSKGVKDHLTVWYATDLKDCPIQMQMLVDDSTLTMKFQDLKLGRPEVNRFQAPAGMAKYDNVNALMSDAVTKKLNSATAK